MSTTPRTHARLDFDRLVRDYMENLNVSLRGFKAAEEFEFLDAWVPNEEPTEGVLELVELGRDAGLARLTVCVSPETWARLDLARLEGAHGTVTRSQEGDLTALTFAFGPEPELAIHPCYRERLRAVLARVTHEGELPPCEGQQRVDATAEGVTLSACVEPARRTVTRAAFRGAADPVRRGLLEAVCAALEGRPLQEGADHALLTVEHELRDRSQPPPVPGLITPENADQAFALPQQLVRALRQDYQERTGFKDTKNFYDRPVSERWARLNQSERSDLLLQTLQRHGLTECSELVGLDGPKRVVVRFSADLDSAAKQAVLARMEDALRQEVEPTLHVVTQAKADVNILRLPEKKKGPGST